MIVLSSCKSNQELVYMQNYTDGELVNSKPFSTDSYQLRPGDNLYIQIASINEDINKLFNPAQASGGNSNTTQLFASESAQYLNGYLINQEGLIKLPVVGNLKVEGKTLEEVDELVQDRVKEYIKDATVIVKLLNFKVTVIGEVASPTVVYSYNNTFTLLEALTKAGGTTEYSRLSKVLVVRETNKGKLNIETNLNDKSFLNSPAFYLQPNDIVYVTPDKNKNLRANLPVFSTTIAAVSFILLLANYLK